MELCFGEGVIVMSVLRWEPWKWRWRRKPKALSSLGIELGACTGGFWGWEGLSWQEWGKEKTPWQHELLL